MESAALRIENAILRLLDEGYRPADLYNEEQGTHLANTQKISTQLLSYLEETENV